ncbi:MAG: NADAR family protein [Bacteroidota bacterium]
MKYDKNWLINELNKSERIKFLFFWGHHPSKDGSITATVFSQWWAGHPFVEDSIHYKTAEHYMMARKARLFNDEEMLTEIVASNTPSEAKKLGRMVKNFDQLVWEKHRCEIVIQGNYLKFSQHPELEELLMNTKNRIIVEASPRDRIWGIGIGKNNENAENPAKWRGSNLLGFCLMEVRDMLIS